MFSAILTSRIEGNGDSRLIGLLDSIEKNSHTPTSFEVLIKFDNDDKEACKLVSKFPEYSFKINHIFDERGRGAMDFHIGYTTLLSIANPNTVFFVTLADDFVVKKDWDLTLFSKLDIMGKEPKSKKWVLYNKIEEDIFLLQHSPYPNNLEFDKNNIENVTGLEIAPAFSKKLIYLCGGFGYMSFTDAWVVLLQHELKHVHNVDITTFTDKEYVERLPQGTGMTVLEQANRNGQRLCNFNLMKTKFYQDTIKTQAEVLAHYYKERELIINKLKQEKSDGISVR